GRGGEGAEDGRGGGGGVGGWGKIVAGGAVLVLLRGPSFATFAARLHEFGGFEFAVPTLNSFPPIERELQRINRCADILLFTQPGSILSWHPELVEFLGR